MSLGGPGRMDFIDTHVHVWDPAKLSYPWLATPGLEALARGFSWADYRAAVDGTPGARFAGGVFCECDVAPGCGLQETAAVLALAGQPGTGLRGLIARVEPEQARFPQDLEALLSLEGAAAGVKGVRRVLHTQPDDLSTTARFQRHVRQIGRLGLSFDLCVLARQLPVARRLAEACPDTLFVLDHCGGPDIRTGGLVPWCADLAAIARLPNVCCKVSGLVAYAAPDAPDTAFRPFFEHAVACFGWERLLFGGDWPVCLLGRPLSGWIELAMRLAAAAGAGDSERDALFRANACRVYRLA